MLRGAISPIRERLRKLFLKAVFKLKLDTVNLVDADAAWNALEDSFIFARLFDSPADLNSAWHFAFQQLPVLHFRTIFQERPDAIIRMIVEISEESN